MSESEPINDFTVDLGRLLHRLRLLRELSIEDVRRLWREYQLTDLPARTLALYELGRKCPSVYDFCVLCSIFGVFPANALASVNEPTMEIPAATDAAP